MERKWVGIAALGVALAVSGCATEAPEKSAPLAEKPTATQTPSGSAPTDVKAEMPKSGMSKLSDTVVVGKPAPDFAIKDEKGQEWHLSDYKGKTVLLDFWAFW